MRFSAFLDARQADENLAPFRAVANLEVPRGGWARAIRDALGMTNVQLPKRMAGKAPQSVDDLLKSEEARTINLSSLDELAKALNCRVVYALVPERPIETLRHERALQIAAEKTAKLLHSMAIEGQSVEAQIRANILNDYASQLLHTKPRKLWD